MFRRSIIFAGLVGVNCGPRFHSSCDGHDQSLVAFSPKKFNKFPITKINVLSHNTKEYVVALPSPEHEMGLETAGLVMIKGPPGEKVIARPYTPTSLNDQKGSFELVVKSYPGGVVSTYLDSLKVGDSIEVKGPFPKLKYLPNMKKSIGMICGGTGITPMLQVVKEILKNRDDKTQVSLIFANNGEDDILLKSTLDELTAKYSNFKVTYILSTPSPAWTGEKGFVSKELICKAIPAPSTDNLVLVCGPPGMMKAVSGDKAPDYTQGEVDGLLKEIGYTSEMVFKF